MQRLVLWVVLLVGAGCFYAFVDPAAGIYPACPFYAVTHAYCPGCGSQRALHALLHGDVLGALDLNPLMMLSVAFLTIESSIWILRRRGQQIRALSARRLTPWLVLGCVLLFWILRNIPVYPFNQLAP